MRVAPLQVGLVTCVCNTFHLENPPFRIGTAVLPMSKAHPKLFVLVASTCDAAKLTHGLQLTDFVSVVDGVQAASMSSHICVHRT